MHARKCQRLARVYLFDLRRRHRSANDSPVYLARQMEIIAVNGITDRFRQSVVFRRRRADMRHLNHLFLQNKTRKLPANGSDIHHLARGRAPHDRLEHGDDFEPLGPARFGSRLAPDALAEFIHLIRQSVSAHDVDFRPGLLADFRHVEFSRLPLRYRPSSSCRKPPYRRFWE